MFYCGDILSEREYNFIIKRLNRIYSFKLLEEENRILKLNQIDMLKDIECLIKERKKLENKIKKLENKIKKLENKIKKLENKIKKLENKIKEK